MCNIKKELGFAENDFLKDYNENVVKPIKYYSTIEDFKNPNIRDNSRVPLNKNVSVVWDSWKRIFTSSIVFAVGAIVATVLLCFVMTGELLFAIQHPAEFFDALGTVLIFAAIGAVVRACSIWNSNCESKMRGKIYRKISDSLSDVSEENIDGDFCNNAVKAYNVLDDILDNHLEISANYYNYELARLAFPRMKNLLRMKSFSNAEEFREAFVEYVESEITHIEWKTEWEERERQREAVRERAREEERKRRELEYEIKEAIRNLEKSNEERKKINDNLEELNRTLDDIEREIKYR